MKFTTKHPAFCKITDFPYLLETLKSKNIKINFVDKYKIFPKLLLSTEGEKVYVIYEKDIKNSLHISLEKKYIILYENFEVAIKLYFFNLCMNISDNYFFSLRTSREVSNSVIKKQFIKKNNIDPILFKETMNSYYLEDGFLYLIKNYISIRPDEYTDYTVLSYREKIMNFGKELRSSLRKYETFLKLKIKKF